MQENEFVPWLMDAKTPSIRYLTLTGVLGYEEDDPRVRDARRAILESGPIPAILAGQKENGQWAGERSFYTPKYVSTHWSMLLLAEFCLDGNDPRFRRGARHMVDTTTNWLQELQQTNTSDLICFWGNLLRYTLQAGEMDERVEKIIHFTALGLLEGECLCKHNNRHACAWGVVRALWGLAALPSEQRTQEVDQAIQKGADFLIGNSHRLVKADYPGPDGGSINKLWFKLNFPLFYQVDILFTLRVLGELGALQHPGAQEALDWLEGLRGKNQRWHGSSPFSSRTWRELGDREETARWVSLQAATILKQAGRLSAWRS